MFLELVGVPCVMTMLINKLVLDKLLPVNLVMLLVLLLTGMVNILDTQSLTINKVEKLA